MKISRRIISLLLVVLLMGSCLSVSALAVETEEVYGIGFVTATSLHLRSNAAVTAPVITDALQDECVVILSKQGDWYKVNYNLQTGYMHSDFLRVSTAENAELGYGTITGFEVNMRQEPNQAAKIQTVTTQGSKCYIIGVNNGWYKVLYGFQTGYIRSNYVELTEIPYENRTSQNTPKFFKLGVSTGVVPTAAALNNTASNISGVTGQMIFSKAREFLGCPYLAGGDSPKGFDCSGYVYYVMLNLGLNPGRSPAEQYRMGTEVRREDLQPGDLVFFNNTFPSGPTHVGIYAGGNEFLHAPNARSNVSYSSMVSGYWDEHFYGARRVI